jgi:crotonobetainyl-CoA:carnitine CoA-transferase CaiB-like acyl-CoA transferase
MQARAGGDDRAEARLRAGHPRLVVTAVTTFGHSGPYAEWKGYPLRAYCGAGVATASATRSASR